MPQRELHRRRRAGRSADNRGAADAECIEQAGVPVGLRGGRRVGRKRRAQIAEARHGDHAQSAGGQILSEIHSLVEPATRTVHDEHRRPLAFGGILDRTAGCGGDVAVRNALAHLLHLRGVEEAFTGPVARRDIVTMRAHRDALAPLPDAGRLYALLAAETLRRTPGRGREEEILTLIERLKD